jgi:hypothetical protein
LDCCYYYQRAVIRDKKTTNSFDIQLKEEARVLCIILLKKMEWRRTGEGRPLARFRFLRRPRSTPTVVKMTTIRNNPVT